MGYAAVSPGLTSAQTALRERLVGLFADMPPREADALARLDLLQASLSGTRRRRGLTPEGCHYSCRVSGGCSVVLVDEAAEPVAAADFTLRRSLLSLVAFGRSKFERPMRPLAVVMVDVDAEH